MLALSSADRGIIGVLAPDLKRAFHVGNGDIGLLAAAFSIVSAVATLPVGVLTDRWNRSRMLGISVLLWAVAMGASGFAVSFAMLFVCRLGLGVVTATGGPTLLSLTGDLFPRRQRGQVLGMIRTGDLLGTGLAYIVVGGLASAVGWRGSFWVMGLPAGVLAWAWLHFHEPRRGHMEADEPSPEEEDDGSDDPPVDATEAQAEPEAEPEGGPQAEPDVSLWEATKYVLSIPTIRVVLTAVIIGDFFFSGIDVFLLVFVEHQYHVGRATIIGALPLVGAAAIAGTVAGGRLGDYLQRRGISSGRLWVGAGGYTLAVAAILPALVTRNFLIAIPFLAIGALGLAAPIPVIDAVRLDVVNHQLWGRSEAIRTLIKTGAGAAGPALFGFLSETLAGGGHGGLRLTILVMLPLLLANGLLLLLGRRRYADDAEAARQRRAAAGA